MSALPVQLAQRHEASQPEASRACWFPIDEAARLMDVHRATLNRDCVNKHGPAGLAKRMPRVIGGPLVWHVHASVSRRLVRAGVEQTESGTSAVHERLAAATKDQRTEAARKARLVVAFRAWKGQPRRGSIRSAYPVFVALHKNDQPPSYSQICEWSNRCPSSDDLPGCMAALLDTRGRPPEGAPSMSEEAWSLYCEHYLTPLQWSHSKCWRIVRAVALEKGWAWPSEDTVARTRDARLTQSQIDMARLGADRWAKVHQTPAAQNPEAWAAGECWEGDNSTLDFFVRVWRDGAWRAVRPLLSCWKDRASRRIMGWHLADRANATTIRQAFISALKVDGVGLPSHVWIDNGKDFKAQALTGVTKDERRKLTPAEIAEQQAHSAALFNMLGVHAHFAQPYNHNAKARIERGFGFIHQDFDREFASWCGSDAGHRPDVDFHRAAVKDVMALPTIDQARERFAEWVAWFNARSEHAIQDLVVTQDGAPRRLSPVEFYERFLPARRVAQDATLELLRPTWSRPLAVTKQGVGLTIAGKTWRYGGGHPALEALVGTDARVYVAHDPDDLSSVVVYDTRFRRLCEARMNQLVGGAAMPKDAIDEAMRRKREQARRAKARPSLVESALRPEELAQRIARESDVARTRDRLREAGHQEAAASANVRLVGTPIDETARAKPVRRAVGSDADTMPRGLDESDYGDVLLDIAPASRIFEGPSNPRQRGVTDEYEISIAPPSRGEAEEPEFDVAVQPPEEDDGYDVLASLGARK